MALGTLVEEVLGFHLEKGHSAADWSVRPLREELLRYAALDVEVLIELRDALAAELVAAGKTEWARQEFAAVLAAKPTAHGPTRGGVPRAFTASSPAVGCRRARALDGQGQIAQAADLSPRRVLPDAAIVEAARSFPANHAQLVGSAGFPAATPGGTRESGWPR